MILFLLACGPKKAPEPVVPPLPTPALPELSDKTLSRALMPHCLHSLDPHDDNVRVPFDGEGYRLSQRMGLHPLLLAGLHPRDQVTSVNQWPLGTAEQWFAARTHTGDHDVCRYVVKRGESQGVVVLTLAAETTAGEGQVERDRIAALVVDPERPKRFGGVRSRGEHYVVASDANLALIEALGLEADDRLVSIGGVTIDGQASYEQGIRHLLTDDTVTIEVIRTGSPLTVTVSPAGPAYDLASLPKPEPRPARGGDTVTSTPKYDASKVQVTDDVVKVELEYSRTLFGPPDPSSEDFKIPSMRVIPHRGPDGVNDGFRVSGIRRGSFIDAVGLKNGDIVHSVNELPLTGMAEIMETRVALKDARTLTFSLTRRGQSKSMTIELVEAIESAE